MLSKTDTAAIKAMAKGANARLARENAYVATGVVALAQPEWTTFEGVDVLRVPGSNFVAIPATGRKNAAKFAVLDINDRTDFACHLTKTEVREWLIKAAS